MEKKKNKRITEIVVTVIIIICLGLIVLELSNNVTTKVNEIKKTSTVNQ